MRKAARDYCERLANAEEVSKAREAVAQQVFELLVIAKIGCLFFALYKIELDKK